MYEQAWPLLEAIAPLFGGKDKIILDMTNPFLTRPDGYGAGLPADWPQAGYWFTSKSSTGTWLVPVA